MKYLISYKLFESKLGYEIRIGDHFDYYDTSDSHPIRCEIINIINDGDYIIYEFKDRNSTAVGSSIYPEKFRPLSASKLKSQLINSYHDTKVKDQFIKDLIEFINNDLTIVIDYNKIQFKGLDLEFDINEFYCYASIYVEYSNRDECIEKQNTNLYIALQNRGEKSSFLLSLIRKLTKVKLKDREEIKERLEEFDVIKDNKIDLISLNNLVDYYDCEFDEEVIKKYLDDSEIKYL